MPANFTEPAHAGGELVIPQLPGDGLHVPAGGVWIGAIDVVDDFVETLVVKLWLDDENVEVWTLGGGEFVPGRHCEYHGLPACGIQVQPDVQACGMSKLEM